MAALILALAAFAFGFSAALHRHAPYWHIRALLPDLIPQAEVSAHPRLSQFEAITPRMDVVMLGDSLTAHGPWAELFPGLRIANRGVEGDRTATILGRLDGVLALQPAQVFVKAGINDIAGGVPEARILDTYARIVERLQTAGVAVVIQSTVTCRIAICGAMHDRIDSLNEGLVRLAEAHGATYVDLNTALADAGGLKGELTWDGIHLLGPAYVAWADRLRGMMPSPPG